MGTPEFAAASLGKLLAADHEIVAVVTRPDAPSGRGRRTGTSAVKRLALERSLPILQPRRPKEPDFLSAVSTLAPDLVAVVAYGRILPPALLRIPSRGAVNVHASLLPRYRGAAPIAWAIARGEATTGVTTIRVSDRLDAGDILLQRATPIAPEETTGELEGRLAVMGADLLIETLEGLSVGTIVPRAQDESLATHAPLLEKTHGVIDWSLPAEEIARRVRAFDPWPGARTKRMRGDGGDLIVRRARAHIPLPGGVSPGLVLPPERARRASGEDEEGVPVVCGEGTLLLLEVQPAGRKRMSATEAVSGRHLAPGDRLGGA